MPKTLPISSHALSSTPRAARLGPIALFAVAYLAVLGVLFAPEGFFLASVPAPDPDPALDAPAE